MLLLSVILLSLALVQLQATEFGNNTNSIETSVVLSRRKRFLVFPEGSSLQLVFCNTVPSINVLADIIFFGYTAALAYELPQDPYSPFNHKADPLHRRADSKAIYYLDEDGKLLYKRPYKRKFIVNPAFAKRSADEQFKKGTREKFKMDTKQMHASKNKREFLKSEHMEARAVEFHRSSRGALYDKIETMLRGLGGNGRQCLLKTLCLIGQTQDAPQGTFIQEMLRAVFTLPKGDSRHDDGYQDYDDALSTTEPCDEAYPDCNEPLSEPGLPSTSY